MNAMKTTFPLSTKQAWIEPVIEQLHVSETATANGVGSDGQTTFSDCTKS